MKTNHKWLIFCDDVSINWLKKVFNSEDCLLVLASRRQKQTEEVIANISPYNYLVQPRKNELSFHSFFQSIKEFSPDSILSLSYSMIIPDEVCDLVENRAFNIHCSLLPHNRGPNPVQWGIIKGEDLFGFTVHQITNKVDAGDIIYQKNFKFDIKQTWRNILDKLNDEIQNSLPEIVRLIQTQRYNLMPQDNEQASVNQRLTPDFPLIDFKNMETMDIYNLIRAQVSPLRGAFYIKNNERIYINNLLSLIEVQKLKEQFE